MELYNELKEAINECMDASVESPEFKRRFSKLIENFFDKPTNDNDIKEVVNLVQISEDRWDEDTNFRMGIH
mgnify:CR=1 FL=1